MNTSAFCSILNLDAHLVWRWYRDHLSGFRASEASGEHYKHDLHISKNEVVRVPIYEPKHFGKSMAIDEKQIGEEMHTILSNRETGKIALLARSMRYEDLQKLLNRESLDCRKVETLTRDLSPLYAKVGSELFFNSSPVADKFHIIRSLLEACQEEVLANNETALEALARSRYLLFKYPDDWRPSQRNRAHALFEKYPEIEKVYYRCCEFRDWMKKEHVGLSICQQTYELQMWMLKVEQDDIDEMLNFKSLIERNMLPVLNYFRFGATNAKAENINSQIQRFIMTNQGTRDREFFYFRIKKYFSGTSK